MENKIRNGILGFIVGDAMGLPLEFTKRKNDDEKVCEMLQQGKHNVEKGSWSDDSSMVVATMQSIINNNGNIDYVNIMDNFVSWVEKGDFTPNNKAFGIGRTTLLALGNYKFKRCNDVLESGLGSINDNGNGSLMRILPIAYYCYYKKINEDDMYDLVKNISSLTHRHNISILGCYIYVLFVIRLLNGDNKVNAYKYIREYDYIKYFDKEIIDYYKRILKSDISKLSINEISSLGFVVDTLESVLWCFINNNSYKDCIIEAINLGNDTDTIGALVGGISGIYYEDIPNDWLEEIIRKEYLVSLCSEYSSVL